MGLRRRGLGFSGKPRSLAAARRFLGFGAGRLRARISAYTGPIGRLAGRRTRARPPWTRTTGRVSGLSVVFQGPVSGDFAHEGRGTHPSRGASRLSQELQAPERSAGARVAGRGDDDRPSARGLGRGRSRRARSRHGARPHPRRDRGRSPGDVVRSRLPRPQVVAEPRAKATGRSTGSCREGGKPPRRRAIGRLRREAVAR